MHSLRRTVVWRWLIAFFVLAYALSWWPALFTGGQILPHGPAIAAVIVLGLSQGRAGLAALWRRVAHWRVGWVWYLIAPGIILVYLLTALVVSLLLGASVTDPGEVLSISRLVPVVVELVLLGGVWEEPGWTAFALPALQARFSGQSYGLLKASLAMGTGRAIWHLPLVVYGHIPWFDLVFLSMALQFVVTWLFNRTRGSVLIVMLAHLTSNVIGGAIMVQLFTGGDRTLYYVTFIATASVFAVLLNYRNGWSMGTRTEPRSTGPGQRA